MSYPEPIPRQGLLVLFATLAGCQVKWRDAATPHLGMQVTGPKAWIRVSLLTTFAKGVDEQRATDQDPFAPGTLVYTLSGYRIFVLTLRAESLDDTLQPFDLLERVRLGIRRMASHDALKALGVALVRTEPIAYLGTSPATTPASDNRTLLVASMDLRLAREVHDDAPGDDGAAILRVNGSDQSPGSPVTITGEVD